MRLRLPIGSAMKARPSSVGNMPGCLVRRQFRMSSGYSQLDKLMVVKQRVLVEMLMYELINVIQHSTNCTDI